MPLLSPAETNLESAAIRPVSCCTSFTDVGLRMAIIATHLSGFASIPLLVSKKPKNLPVSTPKTHFSGFNLRRYLDIVFQVCHVLYPVLRRHRSSANR